MPFKKLWGGMSEVTCPRPITATLQPAAAMRWTIAGWQCSSIRSTIRRAASMALVSTQSKEQIGTQHCTRFAEQRWQ